MTSLLQILPVGVFEDIKLTNPEVFNCQPRQLIDLLLLRFDLGLKFFYLVLRQAVERH